MKVTSKRKRSKVSGQINPQTIRRLKLKREKDLKKVERGQKQPMFLKLPKIVLWEEDNQLRETQIKLGDQFGKFQDLEAKAKISKMIKGTEVDSLKTKRLLRRALLRWMKEEFHKIELVWSPT